MPIQLGYLATRSRGETETNSQHYDQRLQVARRQLACIRTYLYYVNKFFAAQLLGQGHRFPGFDLANYINSEAQALGLGSETGGKVVHKGKEFALKPHPTLSVDLNKARTDRRGLPVSWIFQRLYELATSRVFVLVWDEANPAQTGFGAVSHPVFDDPINDHFFKADWVAVSLYYSDPCRPTAALDERGETYIHELVIHAWRYVKFGVIQSSYRYPDAPIHLQRLYDLYGHHRGGAAHLVVESEFPWPHSQADKEADLLWYYVERFDPQGRLVRREQLNRETGRPQHEKGQFQKMIRDIGGDSLMCDKACRLPGGYRQPRSYGR